MIIAKSKIPQTHNRTAELKIGVKVGDRVTVKHRAKGTTYLRTLT